MHYLEGPDPKQALINAFQPESAADRLVYQPMKPEHKELIPAPLFSSSPNKREHGLRQHTDGPVLDNDNMPIAHPTAGTSSLDIDDSKPRDAASAPQSEDLTQQNRVASSTTFEEQLPPHSAFSPKLPSLSGFQDDTENNTHAAPSDSLVNEEGGHEASTGDAAPMPVSQDTATSAVVVDPQPQQQQVQEPPPPPPQRLHERLMDWFWGQGVAQVDQPDVPVEEEERLVQNIEDEAPFVPIANRQPLANQEPMQQQNAEVVAAAAEAGIEPNPAEGADDIEDLEGIMELIGMQGPLIGLIQNGMFCALLVCMTVGAALWVPYNLGKLFLITVAQPVFVIQQPLRAASSSADMLVDFCIFAAGSSYYWIDRAVNFLCSPIMWLVPSLKAILQTTILAETARSYAERALRRLAITSMESSEFMSRAFDVPKISVLAHESLRLLESRSTAFTKETIDISLSVLDRLTQMVESVGLQETARYGLQGIYHSGHWAVRKLVEMRPTISSLLRVNPLKINIVSYSREVSLDYSLAIWDGKDKSIAILCGYVSIGLIGAVYLSCSTILWGKNKKGRVEGGLADILYQAGGVLKVILIISIEMILFPLYCGFLLDAALLPLFDKATMATRIAFLKDSPNTSLFIHWFIGTCYMFHFALFVSMCRRIMRSGVLCKCKTSLCLVY